MPDDAHWALDISVSDFGSAFDTTTSSCTSTSTFQYINSQLVAHGFTAGPGLSLEGVSGQNIERVTKCLLAMLGQRVTDMAQVEELSTKLRTLSYDHERLMNMHRSSTEQALNAEREANMYKSRLGNAARSLQSSESNHKQTSAELQRTRTSLQALRATHAAELKKKEKEIERMVDKWVKFTDSQAKSSASGIIIHGANAEIVSGTELLGKGRGYLEVALEHAESSRKELFDETTRLRRLILVFANRLQSMMHQIRVLASIKSEEPPSFDHDALFPLTPISAVDDKIFSLFASASDAISLLSKHLSDGTNLITPATSAQPMEADSEECKRLQIVIEKLQTELDEARQLQAAHATEKRELLNQLSAQGIQKVSMENLLITSKNDIESDRLDRIKKELEDEREKFTRAAVRLGKEKSAFESERIKFFEERQLWQAQQMLSEHYPTPVPEAMPTSALPSPNLADYLPETEKSPRKSPRKQKAVGKSGNSRKTRISRRSSIFSILPSAKVEPAYETEVIPIVIPVSKQQSDNKPCTLTKSILPTSFVLPPPSPRTSLPPPDSLLGPLVSHIPGNHLDPTEGSASITCPQPPLPVPMIVEPTPTPSAAPTQRPVPPQTPPALGRPFPMAKPLAPHMTHAYSPVKPSPLSRILMLAESPESPEFEPFPKLDGEDATPTGCPAPAVVGATLAGNDDDSPLREKKMGRNVAQVKKEKAGKADTKKRVSKERSKVKEEPAVAAPFGKSKMNGAGEKENRDKPSRRSPPPASGAPPTRTSNASMSKHEAPSKPTIKVAPKLPVGRGGARRVPVGSAEAAPLPGWRG